MFLKTLNFISENLLVKRGGSGILASVQKAKGRPQVVLLAENK